MGTNRTRPPSEASGIPVFCAYDRLVPIEKVIGNPRNPNTHPKVQVDMLAKIIKAQGWRAPITISTRSGFIVRGHGRLAAAQQLGVASVPVDYQDYDSEASEWADLIADNRLAELSEIDGTAIRDLLQELDTGEIDMLLTGFDDEALMKMLGSDGMGGDPEPEDDNYQSQFGVIVMCADEGEQQEVYERLTADGLTCKVVAV